MSDITLFFFAIFYCHIYYYFLLQKYLFYSCLQLHFQYHFLLYSFHFYLMLYHWRINTSQLEIDHCLILDPLFSTILLTIVIFITIPYFRSIFFNTFFHYTFNISFFCTIFIFFYIVSLTNEELSAGDIPLSNIGSFLSIDFFLPLPYLLLFITSESSSLFLSSTIPLTSLSPVQLSLI